MLSSLTFAAPHHNFVLRFDDVKSYTPTLLATPPALRVPIGLRSLIMGYTASWTFATMLAFGFVAAILLGML
jgi:hypothetical protein